MKYKRLKIEQTLNNSNTEDPFTVLENSPFKYINFVIYTDINNNNRVIEFDPPVEINKVTHEV
jgi:hypothetical protein